MAPETKAVLFGAIGGPEWPSSAAVRPEEGLLRLRKTLNCFANVRPCSFPSESLVADSPIKSEVVRGTQFVILRELCGGIYFGPKREFSSELEHSDAYDTEVYSVSEVEQIARLAALMARELANKNGAPKRVTSVDKANVLASSRLWRQTVTRVMQQEFPDIDLQHLYVDAAAMHMIKNPTSLNGVVLTSNLFGDILSDEASVLIGSLGLSPSASLNGLPGTPFEPTTPGLYEPIHGSAPDIAAKGVANPVGAILSLAMMLRYSLDLPVEAQAVEDAVRRVLDDVSIGGFGFRTADLGGCVSTAQFTDKVCEVLREILGKLDAEEFLPTADVASKAIPTLPVPVSVHTGRRPMTLCEKILAHHAVDLPAPGHVKPGDMICVKVDWTLASELTWKGMEKTYNQMGRPPIAHNDRFWLAIDHTVDPSIMDQPKPQDLVRTSEQFAKEAGLKDFYGPNQTILHTEFYRERAQPGQLIIGADSHSCSAGGLGTFAVGLGAADVVMPLVTGETWFQVPETVNIRFVGKPPFGIGGKDVILWVLGELKRNTVAFERAVEFTGPGCKYLSCDARFAISNMTTEFGGIAGVFAADELTAEYIAKRESEEHKNEAIYFRADSEAQYAETYEIDLSKVESMVALYPSPDNVVPITEVQGMKLDGVFIGACTTAEEDLILAALVLEAGFKTGLTACIDGKRKVTPGSVPILNKLRRLGLVDVYERAGFEVGAPGCSYCLGIAADKAGEGEVWLSSQNRNFKNRMGKGSFGNLASAASVAASSFDMRVTDPSELLKAIDMERFKQLLGVWGAIVEDAVPVGIQFKMSEPQPQLKAEGVSSTSKFIPPPEITRVIHGRVQKFGSHVDTDAIIPAEFMPGKDDKDLGTHCFQYVRPEFRQKVKQGYDIVVAGPGFGSGSSREEAPRALNGAGVKAVIAKSYAYIYSRNQPNMALLGLIPKDFDRFYELCQEGSDVKIDVPHRQIVLADVNGVEWSFGFELSQMEERLISGGGVTNMYNKYGKALFRVAMSATTASDNSETLVPVKNVEVSLRGASELEPSDGAAQGEQKSSSRIVGGMAGFVNKILPRSIGKVLKPQQHQESGDCSNSCSDVQQW